MTTGSGFIGAGLLIVGLWAGGLMIALSGSIPGAGDGGGSTQADSGAPFLSYRDNAPVVPRIPGLRWAEPGAPKPVPSIDAQPVAVTDVGAQDSWQVAPPYFTPSVPNLPPPPDYPTDPRAPSTTAAPQPVGPGRGGFGALPQPSITVPSTVPVPTVTLPNPSSTTSAPTQPPTTTTAPEVTTTTAPREPDPTTSEPTTSTHEPETTTNDPEPTTHAPGTITSEQTVGSDDEGDNEGDDAADDGEASESSADSASRTGDATRTGARARN